jgi:hypothetical protein
MSLRKPPSKKPRNCNKQSPPPHNSSVSRSRAPVKRLSRRREENVGQHGEKGYTTSQVAEEIPWHSYSWLCAVNQFPQLQRRKGMVHQANDLFRSLFSRAAGVCNLCRGWFFSPYHADSGAVRLGLGSCRFGSSRMRRGVGASQREVLGLVGLHRVEKSGIVSGLARGDLAM